MQKEFVVIGLGRFGGSIVKELKDLDADVLAIDLDEQRVNEYKEIANEVVIADTTDENALKSIGVRNFDHVIVSIGDNIQSSILTTIILKELGCKQVTVKAQSDYHAIVLEKIGADYVVHPERDMGRRIAHNIMSSSVLDYLELSDEFSLVEMRSSGFLLNKTLIDLDIRAKYALNIIAIKRSKDIIVAPDPNEEILAGDILIMIGKDKDLNRFEKVVRED